MQRERSESTALATRIISLPTERPLQCLTLKQMYAIDQALAEVGPFGEVRLIKSRDKLRFIQTVRSEDIGPGE
ncbi:MAG TPA: hypothetical protein PLJ35_11365 [Anaerolineae bacterium]|nr:hypothetical protein [Anaerolineae bacterium]HOQ99408.1 hypothetical protein [Anaerolineae bacterium]HPL27812.1 hypothetical protein [Anaerolineae bacterium]